MLQTKTIAMLLPIAIATVGAIGIEVGTAVQSAQAQHGGFGPGQNDNSQGNNNNQGALSCRGGFGSFGNCENVQGNQP